MVEVLGALEAPEVLDPDASRIAPLGSTAQEAAASSGSAAPGEALAALEALDPDASGVAPLGSAAQEAAAPSGSTAPGEALAAPGAEGAADFAAPTANEAAQDAPLVATPNDDTLSFEDFEALLSQADEDFEDAFGEELRAAALSTSSEAPQVSPSAEEPPGDKRAPSAGAPPGDERAPSEAPEGVSEAAPEAASEAALEATEHTPGDGVEPGLDAQAGRPTGDDSEADGGAQEADPQDDERE